MLLMSVLGIRKVYLLIAFLLLPAFLYCKHELEKAQSLFMPHLLQVLLTNVKRETLIFEQLVHQ